MTAPSPKSREEWAQKLNNWWEFGIAQNHDLVQLNALLDSIMSLQSSNERMAEGIRQWCEAFQALIPQEAKAREEEKLRSLQSSCESLRAEVERLGGLLYESMPYMRHGILGGPMCEQSKSSEYPCTCGVDALVEKFPSVPFEKARQPK